MYYLSITLVLIFTTKEGRGNESTLAKLNLFGMQITLHDKSGDSLTVELMGKFLYIMKPNKVRLNLVTTT